MVRWGDRVERGGEGRMERWGQLSQPVKGRADSSQHDSNDTLMDTITDPSCSRTMTPDMAHDCSSG